MAEGLVNLINNKVARRRKVMQQLKDNNSADVESF
jgi:hypothetical protein